MLHIPSLSHIDYGVIEEPQYCEYHGIPSPPHHQESREGQTSIGNDVEGRVNVLSLHPPEKAGCRVECLHGGRHIRWNLYTGRILLCINSHGHKYFAIEMSESDTKILP